MVYIRANMFDKFVYKFLDKVVEWCERYKEYRIKRSLPKKNLRFRGQKKRLKKVGK